MDVSKILIIRLFSYNLMMLLILNVVSCNKSELTDIEVVENENINVVNEQRYISDSENTSSKSSRSEITLGEIHNSYLKDLLLNADINGAYSAEMNRDNIIEYITAVHEFDVSQSPVVIVEDVNSLEPIEFIGQFENDISIELYEVIHQLLQRAEEYSNEPDLMKSHIDGMINDLNNGLIILNEEDRFKLNELLDVYKHSMDLWYSDDIVTIMNSKDFSWDDLPQGAKYWKVPVADWIGGIGAGLLSGGAAAGVGYITSSALAALSLI